MEAAAVDAGHCRCQALARRRHQRATCDGDREAHRRGTVDATQSLAHTARREACRARAPSFGWRLIKYKFHVTVMVEVTCFEFGSKSSILVIRETTALSQDLTIADGSLSQDGWNTRKS